MVDNFNLVHKSQEKYPTLALSLEVHQLYPMQTPTNTWILCGRDTTWTSCVSETETGNACSKNTEGATSVSCFKRGRQQTETVTSNLLVPVSQCFLHTSRWEVNLGIKQNKQCALFWECGGEHGIVSVLPDDFQPQQVGINPSSTTSPFPSLVRGCHA